MKQLIITCMLLLPLTAFCQLSIEEVQNKARENYPLIRQYNLINHSEEYNLANANRGYLPQLSFSAKASYQSEVTQIPISLPGVDIPTLPKDQYQALIDLNQTIWDGGQIRSQKNITKYTAEVDRQKMEVDLYAIRDKVNNLFFGLILLNEQINLNNLLKEEYQNSYNQIYAQYQNGLANQSDLDAIQVEQLKCEQKEIELTATTEAYRQMLSYFIGEPVTENTQLIKPEIPLSDYNYINNRAELRLFDAQNNLYQTMRQSINAASMPRLGLYAQGGYGNPGLNILKDGFQAYYIAGVRLTWNISNLYTQSNKIKQLGLDQRNIEVQRDIFLFNADQQTIQQQSEIKKTQKMLASDDEIIQLRRNIKESAQIKMNNGTLSVSDLIREINAENVAIQEKTLHEIQLLINIENLKTTTNN